MVKDFTLPVMAIFIRRSFGQGQQLTGIVLEGFIDLEEGASAINQAWSGWQPNGVNKYDADLSALIHVEAATAKAQPVRSERLRRRSAEAF